MRHALHGGGGNVVKEDGVGTVYISVQIVDALFLSFFDAIDRDFFFSN